MKSVSYNTKGVCASKIHFNLDEQTGTLHDIVFVNGCEGNLTAISKLLEGKNASDVVELLSGNDCDGRGTSCADQLAKAVQNALIMA